MRYLIIIFCAVLVLLSFHQVQATIIHVPGDAATIQAGVDLAEAGDTVLVACGTYFEHDIEMKSGVCLRSEMGEACCVTIDAIQQGRVIYCGDVDSPTIIEGFTITGGVADSGGGIYCGTFSHLTITKCCIKLNTANYGAGIYLTWANLDLNRCTITNNSAFDGGGGIWYFSPAPLVSVLRINSSILWDDWPGEFDGDDESEIYAEAKCCDIAGGWEGPGSDNIDCDPMFCYPDTGNYFLNDSSCCKGAGCDSLGNPDSTVDIGAFGVGCGPVCRIWYVSTTGNDTTGDGSESNPFGTIQKGIDVATDCDTVLMADGTYVGDGNRDIDFQGKAITVRSQSGNPAGCIIDCEGATRGFRFHSDEDSNSVLEGVTIKGSSGSFGGGISCSGSSPTLANCTFSDNSADYGGGISCVESSFPTISGCVITGNEAYSSGGGIHCDLDSDPTINNCTISGNKTSSLGGGVWCHESSPTFDNTILWGNCAINGGNEGYVGSNSSLTFTCCDVNSSGIEGDGSVIWVQDNIFIDPLFCEPTSCDSAPTTAGDYHLFEISLCAPEQQPYCGLIGALGVGCEVSYPCEYLGRCIDDMYLVWEEHPECVEPLYTIGVLDGEGGASPMYPSQDAIWFMMRTACLRQQFPPLYVQIGKIVCYDPVACDTLYTVETYPYDGLAFDDRDSSFWCASGYRLDHIDESGDSLGYFYTDLPITGLAFDADHNHLWCIAQGDPDMIHEYDVSNGVPELIQGPLEVPWSSPDFSAAGLEYDEERNMLLVVNRNTNSLVYFRDVNPAYPDTLGRDEPGVCLIDSCKISFTPDPWGIALVRSIGIAFIANTQGRPFPMDKYASPCLPTGDLICDCVVNLGDLVYLINYLFRGGPPPEPLVAGDVNCDGTIHEPKIDVGDVVYLINYLYGRGPAPRCV